MSVSHEVHLPNLNQFHWRQDLALAARFGNAQPATPAVILDRVEIAIEIVAAALAAADLADRYTPDPSVAAIPHIAGIFDS
jgi:hypothetical protein